MPLAIKGVNQGSSSVPTHAAGDLLLVHNWGTGTPAAVPSGWTQLASYSNGWSYDALQVIYRIAASDQTPHPIGTTLGNVRTTVISGADPANPIAGHTTLDVPQYSGGYTIPSIDTPGAINATIGSVSFTGGYLTVPDNAALQMGTGDFTIEFWWRPKDMYNTYMTPFSKGYVSAGGIVLQTGYYDNYLRLYLNGTAAITAYAGGFASQWNHIAVTRNNGIIYLAVNGMTQNQVSDTTNFNAAGALGIGAGAAGDYPVSGTISGFRIIKGTSLYNGGNWSVPTQPPTAVSGTSVLTCLGQTTITDSSSNAFTVTKVGSANAYSSSPFAKIGSGLRFTLVAGSGPGGNPSLTPTAFVGNDLTNVLNDSYYQFMTGGVGPISFTGANWIQRYSSLSVKPGAASGFFSMF